MDNFMIGQFGFFDKDKQKKDYREEFYGIEACLLDSDEDINLLQREAKEQGVNIGIHFPLRAGVFPHRDPLFLELDSATRREAFASIEEELNYIDDRDINPRYILFHYPKPVIISEQFDMDRWRFYKDSEYALETEYPREKFVEYSQELFQWLDKKSREYDFIPVLELDAINKYISQTRLLESLLEEFDNVKLCIDLGRLHVQDGIDDHFDGIDILKRFTKYTEIIHLWHAKIGNAVEYSHYPLLPELSVSDGWADVESYFEVIKSSGNNDMKFLFEHRSDLITEEELESCYNWIDELYNRSKIKSGGAN